jgi:hypothetical protein
MQFFPACIRNMINGFHSYILKHGTDIDSFDEPLSTNQVFGPVEIELDNAETK